MTATNSLPLQTFVPGPLLDHDLRVLREYAFYAPPEWRHAFEALLDAAEAEADADQLEAQKDELDAQRKRALERATTLFAAVEAALARWTPELTLRLPPELRPLRQVLESLTEGLDELTKELEGAESPTEVCPTCGGERGRRKTVVVREGEGAGYAARVCEDPWHTAHLVEHLSRRTAAAAPPVSGGTPAG